MNKRHLILKKNQIQKNEQKKLNDLLSSKTNLENQKNLDLLTDENSSLKSSIALSNEITENAIKTNAELDDQEKKNGENRRASCKNSKKSSNN